MNAQNLSDTPLVVFDWDGTLFDSTGTIAVSLQHACAAIGREKPSMKAAKHVIGLGFNEAIFQLVGDISPAQYDGFMSAYRQSYFKGEEVIVLYDGILEMLDGLRQQGKKLAVATGKSRAGLNRVLSNGVLKGYFDATRTTDETASKPHPQMLLELLDEFDVEASQAVMVGDTTYDIDMAHAAHMPSIAVNYGAHEVATLLKSNPSMLAHTPQELARLLGVSIQADVADAL